MNNLKFRAYIKSIQKIADVLEIDFKNKTAILDLTTNKVYPETSYWWKEIKLAFSQVVIMQSTGLKDKYGVEIFEGDILTDEGSFENDYWDYATIEFDEIDYTYYLHWKNEEMCENITECKKYVVAGNIYENKELLENEIYL